MTRAAWLDPMSKEESPALISATPVLPSPDLARTVAFYCGVPGFEEVHVDPREFAILDPDGNLVTFHESGDA